MTRGLGPGMQRKFRKRKKSKGFLKALTGYLVSNSYMYAPLVDYPPMPKATPESLQSTSVSPPLAVRSSAVTNSHAKSNDKEIKAKYTKSNDMQNGKRVHLVQQQKLLVTAEPLGLLKRWFVHNLL